MPAQTSEQADQTWEEKWTLDLLHSKFADDFEAICKLPPLKDDKSLIEAYQLELGRIIRRHRNRFTTRNDYVSTVRRCMKSADAAAQALEMFVRDFVELRDPDAMRLVMTAASIVNPRAFPEWVGSINPLIFALGAIGMTMKDLKPAIKIATGISETQSRGRPFSAYTQAALELIFLWERILLDALPEPKPPLLAKKIRQVPVSKKQVAVGKLRGNKREVEATQVSTEFCRLAFRMINPKMKPQEVRTAINNARREKHWIMWQGRGKKPLREFIADIATGKKKIKERQLFSLPFFVQLFAAACDH